jgi:hypothetical protein
MREVFEEESNKSNKPRLLSSIATAAGEYLLKTGYDIPVLCKYTLRIQFFCGNHRFKINLTNCLRYLDMVNVMTYDLYGNWYNKVGHHSALYHDNSESGLDRELNTVQASLFLF